MKKRGGYKEDIANFKAAQLPFSRLIRLVVKGGAQLALL